MPTPKIEGRWIGYFSYGNSYAKELAGRKIPFAVDIVNVNGQIKGVFLDELSKNLFDKPATIEGKTDGHMISFIKRYPGLVAIDANNQPVALADKPSLPIQYTGTLRKKLFSKKYFIKGSWIISGSFVNEKGFTNYYKFEGEWEMQPALRDEAPRYIR